MITMHGGSYLAHRTEGAIQMRAVRAVRWAALIMVGGFVVAGLWLRFGGVEGYQWEGRAVRLLIESICNAANAPLRIREPKAEG